MIRSKGKNLIDRQIIRLINECVRNNLIKILELLVKCSRNYVINKIERDMERESEKYRDRTRERVEVKRETRQNIANKIKYIPFYYKIAKPRLKLTNIRFWD